MENHDPHAASEQSDAGKAAPPPAPGTLSKLEKRMTRDISKLMNRFSKQTLKLRPKFNELAALHARERAWQAARVADPSSHSRADMSMLRNNITRCHEHLREALIDLQVAWSDIQELHRRLARLRARIVI